MKPNRRYLWCLLAVAAVALYWLIDRFVLPFDEVRRYGRLTGHFDWARQMPPGEWAWYAALLLATGAALALLLAWPRRHSDTPPPANPWRIVLALALLATVAAGAVRVSVLDSAAITDDEAAHLFAARTLASGRLTAEPPPAPEHFEHIFLGVYRGRWFSQYLWGHALLLALGVLVGLPGLITALLAGVIVLGVFLLARELFDERTGLAAAFLAAFSPLIISTGATLASQTSATALVLLGLWLTLRATATGRFGHAFAAALCLGFAFWCRQQEPALLGLGAIILLVRRIVTGPGRARLLAGGALGSLLVVVPLVLIQWRLWDQPFWTNYQAYWWGYLKYPGVSPYGFGPAPWEGVHTPGGGLMATLINLTRLDMLLLGLPLTLVAAGVGLWRARRNRRAWAIFAGVPLTFGALFFYFWPGLADTGPHLYHAAGAVLLPFVAAGALALLDRFHRPLVALTVLALAALLTVWPSHLGALHRAARAADEIPRRIASAGIDNAVVFTDLYPWAGGNERSWRLGSPLPRPNLSDSVLYLRTRGGKRDRDVAREVFPRRRAFMLKVVDGQLALLALEDYTGKESLRRVARPRNLPPRRSGLQ
ncbi:MAG: glycosyltransferase family 39 protein [Candidatus Lernaella stagnicola]|nr:glycosyltransferase family 39 protein [Candidatus Lernaella stagnicola]